MRGGRVIGVFPRVTLEPIPVALDNRPLPRSPVLARFATPQAPEPSRHETRLGLYGHLPLSFEVNQGQTDGQVQFLAHSQGYTLFLTAREPVLAFRPPAAHGQRPMGLVPRIGAVQDAPDRGQTVVRMQLLGANPAPQAMGLEEAAR